MEMKDRVLYSFSAYPHGVDGVGLVSFGLAVLFGLGVYYWLKVSLMEDNRRYLYAMLLGFGALIALGTGLLKVYSLWRLQPIVVYNTRVVTPYGAAVYKNLIDFGIQLEKKTSLINPEVSRDSVRYLMLFEKGGKTHVLSEGDYPIDSIYATLNRIVE